MGKNIRSLSTEPHADRRPTYNGVRPGSPRGSLRHCCLYPSAMQPSARYLPPWLGQTRAPLASMCRSNPHQEVPSTNVTASHVTQGREEYESTIPQVQTRVWICGRLGNLSAEDRFAGYRQHFLQHSAISRYNILLFLKILIGLTEIRTQLLQRSPSNTCDRAFYSCSFSDWFKTRELGKQ